MVIGGPLLLLGLVSAVAWVKDFAGLGPVVGERRVSEYPGVYRDVMDRYQDLSARDRAALLHRLAGQLSPVPDWLDGLQRSGFGLLCLGEDHEDSTRRFLAREFFGRVDVDVLALETTTRGLEGIRATVASGGRLVRLLDADLSALLGAALARNPGLRLAGIEETRRQRINRHELERPGLRDDSVVANFWGHFEPGGRHVVLFGALHCADRRGWLYRRLFDMAPGRVALGAANVRVVGVHQDPVIRTLARFLRDIGVVEGDFVVSDTRRLEPMLRDWFGPLESTFHRYRTLVVFRGTAPP
jgi:hypothetical protein